MLEIRMMEARDRNDPTKPKPNPASLVVTLKGKPSGSSTLAFSPDRSLLATGGRDEVCRIWDIGGNARERGAFEKVGGQYTSLAFSPNGRTLAAGSGSLDGSVWLFDVTEKMPREVATLRGARGAVDAIAFSADGKLIASGGEDRTLRVWEPGADFRCEARARLTGHTGPIKALAFSPDGQGVATAARDLTVRLWSLGRIRSWERAILTHPSHVCSMAWSPDGKTVATACQDGIIRLWDATALKPSPWAQFGGGSGEFRLLIGTPDNSMLVAVYDGLRVVKWEARTGRKLHEWDAVESSVAGVALTQDGRYLAVGRPDGTIGIYRVAEKRA
jgi:WD40 repeat protein